MTPEAANILSILPAACHNVQAVVPILFQRRPWSEVLVQLLPYILVGLLAALVLVIVASTILKHLLHRRVLGFVSGAGGMTIGAAALLAVVCVVLATILFGARDKGRQTAGPFPATQADPNGAAGLTPVAPCREPVVLGWDFSRRGHDGGPAPLGLGLLWSHREEDVMFLSSPAVVGERVYVGSCQLDVTGKYGSVLCLDAASGRIIWQTTSAEDRPVKPIFSSPAVTADGQRVVIGQGLHDDRDCSLVCLDGQTGQVRWQIPTPLHIESSPAIRGNIVAVGVGAVEGPDRKPSGDPGFVVAASLDDGAVLWRYPLADPESSPAIDDEGTVYIGSGFNGRAVVALRSQRDEDLARADMDRLLWRTAMPYPVTGPVTLVGDLVVVGGGDADFVNPARQPAGAVTALDRRTGQVHWQRRTDDAVLGRLAAGDGKVVCPVRNGQVLALDLADGRILWRQRVSGRSPVLAGPAVAGRYVYAVSSDGRLAILDSSDGRVVELHYLFDKGRSGTGSLSVSSPTVAGGRVFVGSEAGGLRCLVGRQTGD